MTASATLRATRTATLTPTVTPTFRTIGGVITAFGTASANGQINSPIGVTRQGYPVFLRRPNGFLIYVEARPGISGLPVGTVTFDSNPENPDILPDLQILSSRPLGNGSAAVCDIGPAPSAPVGGVPAVNPPVFGGSQAASNAINDLSCRFDARTSSDLACTRDAFQAEAFVSAASTVQFCTTAGVGAEIAFPTGDTTVTARVRDIIGQPGLPVSIVIRAVAD